jgi:hypothetical protein
VGRPTVCAVAINAHFDPLLPVTTVRFAKKSTAERWVVVTSTRTCIAASASSV